MAEQDTIVFRIERDTPIALEQLTFGMMALGAEYERFIRRNFPRAQDHEADLLVRRITEKCIWIELVGALAPIFQGMNNVLIFMQFVEAMREKIGTLSSPGGRLQDTTTRELADIRRMAETISGDRSGEAGIFALEYQSEEADKKVAAKVVWRSHEAERVVENTTAQIKEITGADPNVHRGVLMRLYQTNIGEPLPDRASGEKGIIESITDAPKRLIYASELAGQKIKSSWVDGRSPYELGFTVDIDVQMVNGKPRAYRIMDVQDVFPLDEDQD